MTMAMASASLSRAEQALKTPVGKRHGAMATPNHATPRDAEISALLSLSGSASVTRATPLSILSNNSKNTQEKREELQDLLSYIDGISFVTPHQSKKRPETRKELFVGADLPKTPAAKAPKMTPTLQSIMKSAVLGDKTNSRTVNFNPAVFQNKTPKKSTAFATPSRFLVQKAQSPKLVLGRDPTPSRPKSTPQEFIYQEDDAESLPSPQAHWESPSPSSTSFPSLHRLMLVDPSQSRPDVQDSMIVELSREGEWEYSHSDDSIQAPLSEASRLFSVQKEVTSPDPPENDSRISTLPIRSEKPVAIDPEPTHVPPNEVNESILLASPLVDRDLLQHRDYSHLTTHFDLNSYSERLENTLNDTGFEDLNEVSTNSIRHVENVDAEPCSLDLSAETGSIQSLIGRDPQSWLSKEGNTILPEMNLSAIEETNANGGTTPKKAKELLRSAVYSLREARSEREAARQWANDMKEAVNKWAEEQRKLIHCETKSKIDVLEEREKHLRDQNLTLENLNILVHELHKTLQSSSFERKEADCTLKELILEQQGQIEDLSRQLDSMEQTVSEGMSIQQRLTPRSMVSSVSQDPPATERRRGRSAFPQFVERQKTDNSVGGNSRVSTASSKRTKEPLPDGSGYVIKYSNGVQKEVHKDGTTVTRFANGDIETDFAQSNTLAYFHAADQVLQISTPDKSILFEYPNGQIERHYPDGTKAILYPDGTKAKITADGKVGNYNRV